MAGFSSRDYINALSRRLHAVYPNSQAAAGAVSSSALSKPLYSAATGSSDYTERSWWDANTDPQSGLGRVIDVVARPLYAVGSILEQSRDTAEYLAKGKTENPHVER